MKIICFKSKHIFNKIITKNTPKGETTEKVLKLCSQKEWIYILN